MSIIRSLAHRSRSRRSARWAERTLVIVTAAADVELAAAGTRRRLQLCRSEVLGGVVVLVDVTVADEFVAGSSSGRRRSRRSARSSPAAFSRRSTAAALDRYATIVDEVRAGGEVLCGGRRLDDGDLARATSSPRRWCWRRTFRWCGATSCSSRSLPCARWHASARPSAWPVSPAAASRRSPTPCCGCRLLRRRSRVRCYSPARMSTR